MSILTGRCDICNQELLDVGGRKCNTRNRYSYYKVAYQDIFGYTKYSVFKSDICSACFGKIMECVESLMPPKETDELDEAFEEEIKDGK